MPGKDARQTAVVVERTYELLLWLLAKNARSNNVRLTTAQRSGVRTRWVHN
jgi:hypothetical protein